MKSTGWPRRRLDELGFVGRGKSRHRPRNEPSLYGGPYPFIQTADIMAATPYITSYSQTYSELGLRQSKMWPANTLCITIAGANTAKVAILKIEACFPDSVVGFIPDKSKANLHFVLYSLGLMKDQFLAVSRGATQDNLGLNKLLSFPLLAPDVRQQQKIAAILSAYDELIENNKRRIALLEKLAEEIYSEWFVRLRFPRHKKVKVFKRVPEGWREAKLGELIPEKGLLTGKRPKGGAQDSGVPSIGAENVIGLAQHDFSKEKYVNEQFFDSMRQGHVADKDILFYKDGAEIGRVTLVQDGFPHEKCCVNEHVFLVRTRDLVAQYFLYFYLSQPRIQEHVKTINKNAAQPGINKAELRSIPIVLPPAELITEFERLVSPIIRHIFKLAKAQRILWRTREQVLPRLISGKLSVENLDIQFPPGMAEESVSA